MFQRYMDRRTYLAASVGLGIVSLSGCIEENNTEQPEFGDPVTYEGIRVTPLRWTNSNEFSYRFGDVVGNPKSSPEGAEYIFVDLRSEHVGENSRVLPSTLWGYPGDIYVQYRGEGNSARSRERSNAYVVDGTELESYDYQLDENGLTGPIYSGSVDGWIAFQTPSTPDLSDLYLTVQFGASSVQDYSGLKQVSWRFNEESRVHSQNIE